jgi:hypothetical protein
MFMIEIAGVKVNQMIILNTNDLMVEKFRFYIQEIFPDKKIDI